MAAFGASKCAPTTCKFLRLCRCKDYCGQNNVINTFSNHILRRNFSTSDILAGGNPKSHWRQNRDPALTKLRVDKKQKVTERRAYGGHKKLKALKINKGLYLWKSQDIEYVSPILRVVYSSANKNFARQGIMVKGTVVEIDGSKFKEWLSENQENPVGDSEKKDTSSLDTAILEQLITGKFYARITSRPGQEGVCNGYILEGDELNELFSTPQVKLSSARQTQTVENTT